MVIFKISSTSSSPIHSSLILPSSLSPPVLPFTACNAGEPELHELMDGVPEALDSDKLYAGHEQRSSRSWRSSRQASNEALAAAGAWGRRSSQPASREAQRPAKLAASEQGDACGRRSLGPGKLAAGEQGGAATGEACGQRARRRLRPAELVAGEARGRRARRRSDRQSSEPESREARRPPEFAARCWKFSRFSLFQVYIQNFQRYS